MQKWILGAGLLAMLSAMPVLADDKLINQGHEGQTYDYRPALVHGKLNIVDFYSEFCPPCRRVMPKLEQLSVKNPNVVVLRVDINRPGHQCIDWGSPVAQQYGLHSIPHFVVYDADGKQIAADAENDQSGSKYVYGMLQQAGL
ncbi:MAG TPA: thioredoxin family protein [Candidatus Xenobia bacterium]